MREAGMPGQRYTPSSFHLMRIIYPSHLQTNPLFDPCSTDAFLPHSAGKKSDRVHVEKDQFAKASPFKFFKIIVLIAFSFKNPKVQELLIFNE